MQGFVVRTYTNHGCGSSDEVPFRSLPCGEVEGRSEVRKAGARKKNMRFRQRRRLGRTMDPLRLLLCQTDIPCTESSAVRVVRGPCIMT